MSDALLCRFCRAPVADSDSLQMHQACLKTAGLPWEVEIRDGKILLWIANWVSEKDRRRIVAGFRHAIETQLLRMQGLPGIEIAPNPPTESAAPSSPAPWDVPAA